MRGAPCLLVLAKAPVAGFTKTRLCPPATPDQAAAIAAAALLDTLDAVLGTGLRPVVALAGDLARAVHGARIDDALADCSVLPQRGSGLAERLMHAHADTAALTGGAPVLQIGGDTPQVTPGVLTDAATMLSDGHDAVLGKATDGGWWALGLTDPARAAALRGVPMSTPDTWRLTRAALHGCGLRVSGLSVLSDVDTLADAERVAALVPHSRFARAVAAVGVGVGEG